MPMTPNRAAHDMAHDMTGLWFDWMMLSVEAAQVIGLRMIVLSGGGSRATTESERMVEEKMRTLTQVGMRMAMGQWGVMPQDQAKGATKLMRGRVRANLNRLG